MSSSARSLLQLVPLFFGSGVSSLIYQILWMRMLALVFGVTVHAATTVLASFMAGLAIGSALAGRLARRTASPLRWFGIIEVCIGVSALLTHVALPEVARMFGGWQSRLPDAVAPQTIARFIGAFTVLLVPTTLMGMTLPLVLKASDTADANTGRRISVLYGTNTAGAVTGALLAGFVLIGAVGVTWSFRIAAILNMLVGAIALWLARDTPAAGTTRTPPTRSRGAGDVPRVGVAVFALSGFAALALEVIWFRMLVYFVPATSYAFSTMLAAVLLGLTLGSYCATPLLRRADRLAIRLAWIHYSTALCVPLAATAIASAYRAGWHTTADIHISVVLALPPAVLMGMAYPLGLRLWGLNESGEGIDATRVGDLNSANLLGGIAGAIAGGFVVLPWVGTRTGLVVLAMAYLINSLILVRNLLPSGRGAMVGAIGSLVAVAAAATVPDMLVVAGTRRYPVGEQLIWQQEGAQTRYR